MPLEEAFSLTPKESYLNLDPGHYARMYVEGVSHYPQYDPSYRFSFHHQHESDELLFHYERAGDAATDYAAYARRKHVPHVHLYYNLSAFDPHKEVALTFRFDAVSESRVLVFTNAGLIDEVMLIPGDDQFLIEIESPSFLHLYFIHAILRGSSNGGSWFFRGIDAYVA